MSATPFVTVQVRVSRQFESAASTAPPAALAKAVQERADQRSVLGRATRLTLQLILFNRRRGSIDGRVLRVGRVLALDGNGRRLLRVTQLAQRVGRISIVEQIPRPLSKPNCAPMPW